MRVAVIDGNAFAAELKSRLADEVTLVLSTNPVRPGLATVIAGDDYAAEAYERRVVTLPSTSDATTSAKGLDRT
ncbi:MAG: hypothetical protein M3360_01265 [Actinomycetota bacterium]|nr:hypothetical protein [Actinomycetota bacterium]